MAITRTNLRDWEQGHQMACAEYLSGDVYDVPAAIESFLADPADTDFQRGYLSGLMSVNRVTTKATQS